MDFYTKKMIFIGITKLQPQQKRAYAHRKAAPVKEAALFHYSHSVGLSSMGFNVFFTLSCTFLVKLLY